MTLAVQQIPHLGVCIT